MKEVVKNKRIRTKLNKKREKKEDKSKFFDAYLLVYDTSNKDSFKALVELMKLIKVEENDTNKLQSQNQQKKDEHNMVSNSALKYVLANKKDLSDGSNKLSKDDFQ